MKMTRRGNIYFLALEPGESVREEIEGLAARQAIKTGIIDHGIGAVERVQLAYYDLQTRKYLSISLPEGGQELVSLQGNIAWKDKKPFLHAHVSLGDRDGLTRSGHLVDAIVHVTVELVILTFHSLEIGREYDERVGLPLWNFPGRERSKN